MYLLEGRSRRYRRRPLRLVDLQSSNRFPVQGGQVAASFLGDSQNLKRCGGYSRFGRLSNHRMHKRLQRNLSVENEKMQSENVVQLEIRLGQVRWISYQRKNISRRMLRSKFQTRRSPKIESCTFLESRIRERFEFKENSRKKNNFLERAHKQGHSIQIR